MKLYNGYGIVLRGIIERDEAVVHEGLEYMLECHKKIKEYKGSLEGLFSTPVLGLAKLAINQGVNVTIDDPIAPKIMLEKHEVDYPELEFI